MVFRSILVKNNDMHMVIYLSSLIRCIIALHDLVVNKIAYNDEVGDELEKVKEKKAAIKVGGDASEEKKEDDGDSKKAAAGGGDKTAESKKKSS